MVLKIHAKFEKKLLRNTKEFYSYNNLYLIKILFQNNLKGRFAWSVSE